MSRDNESGFPRSVAAERRPDDEPQECELGTLRETLWAPVNFWWFPAVRARFGDRLEELAGVILTEMNRVGSFWVADLEFELEGERICFFSSVDPETRRIGADVELSSALGPVHLESMPGEYGGEPTGEAEGEAGKVGAPDDGDEEGDPVLH